MTAVDPEFAAVAEAVRGQNRPLAIDLATRALKRGHRHPLILLLAAEGLEERGEAQRALELLQAATRAAPQHRVAWMRLAALLARQRKFEPAAAAFDAAMAIDPNSYPALMGAAEMRMLLSDLPLAERYYSRAAQVEPGAAAPIAILAVMAAQQGKTQEARELAGRAAALEPGILGAEMAIARADLQEGAPALAEARLTSLLGRTTLDDDNRAGALDVRANAFDILDRPAEAFADYEARNTILIRLNASRFGGEAPEGPLALARRLTARLTDPPPADVSGDAWRASAGEDSLGRQSVRRHVFLLGFPRSGTTLLEKALGGHPKVVTLEEVNHLAAAGRGLLSSEATLRRLANLTAAEADVCRQTYWRGVSASIGGDLSSKTLIDKLPLHTLSLPLISKLFPDAKILFAVRDPRDVVLSCYRRRFRVNSSMFEFLTLAGAARFYDAVMSLASAARARLPMDIREARHEAIVADFDGEMGAILSFIGLDWDPAVRTFANRIAGRMRTPSYSQLARGLNADGVGQWRRYERQMGPIVDGLEPWVAKFGYPPR